MLLGVSIISYVISLFQDIVATFTKIDGDQNDHSDELTHFFSVLTDHFNNERQYKVKMVE